MATVKSLEERLDDFAEEFSDVKENLVTVVARLDAFVTAQAATQAATQAQLANLMSAQATTQAQLASQANAQATTQSHLAVLTVRLETVTAELAKTNNRLETTTARIDTTNDRIDKFLVDFADFRGRAETVFTFLRWTGVTATGVLIAVVTAAFTLSSTITTIQNRLDTQQKTLDEIRTKLK